MRPRHLANACVIRAIHAETDGDDAEALARLFEDERIVDDGTLAGRLDAVLEATEHRWLPWFHTPLDVPALFELRRFGDRGFRDDLRDPWAVSRDQAGHLLTALALALYPARLRERRFGLRVRDLAGAPRHLHDREVALRLAVGHEKAPDPGRHDPWILPKLRRQFRAAADTDVAAFECALGELASAADDARDRARQRLESVAVGSGTGNSRQDLLLTLLGYDLARRLEAGGIVDRREVAAWVRCHLADDPAA